MADPEDPDADATTIGSVSLQLRVRRTTTEDAYVAILVHDGLLAEDDDGIMRIVPDKVHAEAQLVARHPGVDWRVEEVVIEAHPWQDVRPEDRPVFDSIDMADPS